jgi:DNA-binding GntR family transcriptional regulator
MTVEVKSYEFLPSLPVRPRGGASMRVAEILREAIASNAMAPGEWIDKNALCERLGLSRSPVSEALARLKDEGLVEIEPQSGSYVSRIRLSDVHQNLFLRRALESEAMRHLAGSMLGGPREGLARNLRYQKTAIEAEDAQGFHALDVEFHEILLKALDFPRVSAVVENARFSLERVRRLLATPRRNHITYSEHERIYQALQLRDGQEAARAMMAHLDSVFHVLHDFAQANPQLFADLETK